MSRRQTIAQNMAATATNRAEEEAAYRKLHGKRWPDVDYLRRHHVVIKNAGGYAVDGKQLSGEEFSALAERRRQRDGGGLQFGVRKPLQTASGLRIGESVPIGEKRKPVTSPKPSTLSARVTAPVVPRRRTAALSGAAAISKAKAAEHSTELGTRPRVVWLDLALLQVDHRYQRDIAQAGQAHVNRLLRAFNWNCYQPIIVSERGDGTYAVIDGQHRLEAARKHPLINELPCYIVDAPTVAAQAAIFSTVNGRRLGLTSLQKFWASHAAGEEQAVAVHAICKRHGVTILRGIPSYDIPAKSVLAPFTLQKMLARVGKPAVDTAIGLLAETHGERLNAFRSPTMVALATIAAGTVFSRNRWTQVLKRVDLDKLYDEARTDRVTGGGTLETATERVLRKHAGLSSAQGKAA